MGIVLLLGGAQGLVEIGLDVLDVFNSDRHTDVLRGDAGLELFLFGELGVGGGRGMDDQRLGVADVGQVAG